MARLLLTLALTLQLASCSLYQPDFSAPAGLQRDIGTLNARHALTVKQTNALIGKVPSKDWIELNRLIVEYKDYALPGGKDAYNCTKYQDGDSCDEAKRKFRRASESLDRLEKLLRDLQVVGESK